MSRLRSPAAPGLLSSETSPLLQPPPPIPTTIVESTLPQATATPLPVRQVVVLCLMRVAEPVAFTLIFPFVIQMVAESGITNDPKKVGYYAGIIEALFALTTFCTVVAWGRLSDRIGRVPVLVFGLGGVFLSCVAFGLSHSFLAMVVARCIGGGLNGNVAVIKSMMGEITDSTNQGRAFSILPLSWSVGAVIGPLIGGFLSNPATNFPNTFGKIQFFHKFPYALPCFVGAAFPLVGTILGLLFLQESLPQKTALLHPKDLASSLERRRHAAFVARTSTTIPLAVPSLPSTPANGRVEEEEVTPPFSDLYTSAVFAALTVYAFLALETVALDAVLILVSSTSVQLGGLGLSSSELGTALSAAGMITVGTQILLFPPLQHRFGTTKLYRAFMTLYPGIFALFPVMVYVAAVDAEKGAGKRRTWVVLGLFLILKSIANMAYGCNMLNVTAAAPSRRLLGTLNGVAQMCSSGMRAIGPIIASSLFAYSMSSNKDSLVYWALIGTALAGSASTLMLKEKTGGWREAAVAEPSVPNETGNEP